MNRIMSLLSYKRVNIIPWDRLSPLQTLRSLDITRYIGVEDIYNII